MNPCASLCRDDRVGQSFPPFLPSFCFNKSSPLLLLIFLFASTKSPSPRLLSTEPSFAFRRALVCFSSSLRLFSTSPIAFSPVPIRVLFPPQSRPFLSPMALPTVPCGSPQGPLSLFPVFFSSFPLPYNIIRCQFCEFFPFFCLVATFLHFLAKKSL